MASRNAVDVWNVCSYRVNIVVTDTPRAAAAVGPVGLCTYSLLLKYTFIRSELHLEA